MEVDIEELAKLLFPEGLPCNLVDNDEFSKYIIQLATCGTEKLSREGSHLKDEKKSLLDDTVSLVYSNYKTFIHTAECSKTIFKQFSCIENNLEGLLSGLPVLKQTLANFLSTSRNLSNSRHLTSLTLLKHSQLLEILELPQLMDTCVRNGYYEDALQILAYSKRLEKKHTNIPIVTSIVWEVQGCQRLMLSQLLNQLRTSLTLPQCLKIVGLLRRLNLFSEAELRLKFLQSRDSWFTSLIKAVIKDDPYQHISKVIETSRVHLFDIVTQYRAIFSDDDVRFSISDVNINEEAIFQGWIIHKVEQFFTILEIDLGRGVGSNLESILAQTMFFGQSFGRIGADFRPNLIPIFKRACLTHFQTDIRNANLKFDETFSSFSLMDVQKVQASSSKEDMSPSNPPLSLMEFPPLAHYMNALINGFSNLRLCCPLSLIKDVVGVLSSSVEKVVSAILDLHKLERSGFTESESKSFERMCTLVHYALLPHINICLRALFPLHMVTQLPGTPTTVLQKQNCGQLDIDKLALPLKQFVQTSPAQGQLPEQGQHSDVVSDSHVQDQPESDTSNANIGIDQTSQPVNNEEKGKSAIEGKSDIAESSLEIKLNEEEIKIESEEVTLEKEEVMGKLIDS